MKSIEERATEYSKGQWDELTASTAYFAGATEQKAIEIDKACEWLKARNVLTEASLEGFRKAMEE